MLTLVQGDADPSEIADLMTQLRIALLKAATEACNEKTVFTTAQFKQLLKLGLVGVRQTQRTSRASAQEIWQSDSWRSLSRQLAASPRYKQSVGLQKMSEQIAQLSNKSNESVGKQDVGIIATKRKVDDLIETEEPPVVKKKTKRKKPGTVES